MSNNKYFANGLTSSTKLDFFKHEPILIISKKFASFQKYSYMYEGGRRTRGQH